MAETPRKVAITVADIKANAELSDCHTAHEIWRALPIEGTVSTWGDEIYFSIPVKLGAENARELVSQGEIGYWPTGTAFCIFFGPTPVSQGAEIRPASPVNVFGRILGDATIFRKVAPGARIRVERVEKTEP
jgi:hypothetical protein